MVTSALRQIPRIPRPSRLLLRCGPYLDALAIVVLVLPLLVACTSAGTQAKEPSASPMTRGAELYAANCQGCHGGARGGRMMDIPPPHNANGHTWHHPDCVIKDIILNGPGPMSDQMRQMMGASENTPQMPAFKGQLSDEDIEAILGYIKEWWTPEQREWQAEVSRSNC